MGKNVVALPAAAGLLVQTDLGRLECTPPCALVVHLRQKISSSIFIFHGKRDALVCCIYSIIICFDLGL